MVGGILTDVYKFEGLVDWTSITHAEVKSNCFVKSRLFGGIGFMADLWVDVLQIKRDGMTHLIVIPLYPQFSISTSGSSLRLLEKMFESDPALSGLKHSVIASW